MRGTDNSVLPQNVSGLPVDIVPPHGVKDLACEPWAGMRAGKASHFGAKKRGQPPQDRFALLAVERGRCTFSRKLAVSREKGYSGVVVVDTEERASTPHIVVLRAEECAAPLVVVGSGVKRRVLRDGLYGADVRIWVELLDG